MQPLNDWVIIEADKKEELKGIVLPDTVESERSDRGVVVAGANEGEHVLFVKYGAERFMDGDRELFAIKSEDIIAIL